MKTFLLLTLATLFISDSFAQEEVKYNAPKVNKGDIATIEIKDVVASAEFCKLKYIVKNESATSFIVFSPTKTGFKYDGNDVFFPAKGKEVIVFPKSDKARTLKIANTMDYRVANFDIVSKGIMAGEASKIMKVANLALESGESVTSSSVKVTSSKYSYKKGKGAVVLEIEFIGTSDQLLTIGPSKFTVVEAGGDSKIDIDFGKDKTYALLKGQKQKLKISFIGNGSKFILGTGSGIHLAELKPVSVLDINIKSATIIAEQTATTTTTTTVGSSSSSSCPNYKGAKDGITRVHLFNDQGTCFKLNVNGTQVVPDFTSDAIIYLSPGKNIFKFTLANGHVVEEKKFISDMYDAVGYRLKEKDKGDYTLKYLASEQQTNAKGEQQMSDMMERTKASTQTHKDERDKESESVKTENSSSSTTENNSGSKETASNDGCYGTPSSGSTTVKLKITMNGNPLSGFDIQIKQGGPIGNAVANSSGVVTIKTNSLNSKNIDVYGCKGSQDFNVTGDWVILDGNNYFHIKLEDVQKALQGY